MIANRNLRGLMFAALVAALIICAVYSGGSDSASGYSLQVKQGGPPSFAIIKPYRGFETIAMPDFRPDPVHYLDVPILMYHHVGGVPAGADNLRQGLTVPTEEFQQQMDYLAAAGHTPISQSDFFMALFYGDTLPPNPVILTFDDGYMDNYQQALPILLAHEFPATFYILTGQIGMPDYMGWQQVIDLDRLGMDVGAHTVNHLDLAALPPDSARAEIERSAATLYEELGHPVYWFSYPAGKFNETVRQQVWHSGFLLAATTFPGEIQNSNAPYVLHRYRVEASTSFEEFVHLVE